MQLIDVNAKFSLEPHLHIEGHVLDNFFPQLASGFEACIRNRTVAFGGVFVGLQCRANYERALQRFITYAQ